MRPHPDLPTLRRPHPAARATILTALALTSLASACGGDQGGTTAGPATAVAPAVPAPARVILGAATDTLAAGEQRRLTATVADARGATLHGAPVVWVSSDPAVATVDSSGALVALAPGRAELWATSAGARASMTVVVRPRPVAALVVVAGADTVYVGRSATVRVRPVAADGTPLDRRAVAWAADDSSVVAPTAAADGTVVVRALRAGQARLVATSEGVTRALPVTAAVLPVATLTLAGAPDTLAPGVRATVRATASGADGEALTTAERAGRAIGWESSDSAVVRATDAGDGVATLEARRPGAAVVRARIDGRAVQAAVVVPAPAAVVRVWPTAIVAAPGASGRLTAQVPTATGALAAAAVTWRSTDPNVATVDASGRVTLRRVGTAEVVATTHEGGVGRTTVTVQAPPAGAFRIDLRPVGPVSDAVLAAARRAAARWERVIVGGLAPQAVSLDAGACDEGTPAVRETVRDVVVFLRLASIDGARGTLAYAGPCVVRRGGLPVLGIMVIDADDAAAMSEGPSGFAADVIAHEIGHVLGLGTLWNGAAGAPSLLANPTGSDLRFGGSWAVEAAARAGFTTAGVGVPVEQDGGEGTAGGHWREQVFRGELMTGWVNSAPNPLSVVTVAALRDLGFRVTETGADIVSPVSAAGGAAFLANRREADGARGASLTPHAERLVRPRWEVGPDGRPVTARRR